MLLSWVSALSGPTDWRRERWRSKHYAETESQVWGLGVQVWTGTSTPRLEWSELVSFVPGVQARRVLRSTQLGYIGS